MEAGHGGGSWRRVMEGGTPGFCGVVCTIQWGGASGAVLNEHAQHNKEPKPYICTAQAKDIVA